MEIHLAQQTVAFFHAILVGAALGLLYDCFRIARIALPHGAGVVFGEDLVFFATCAVTTFFFLLGASEGQVRVFLLVGVGLGAVVYRCSLSLLVMGVSKTIIRIVHGILAFLFRWILYPVWRLAYHIVALILRPFVCLAGFLKKRARRAKFSLKVRRRILYNHCKGLYKGGSRRRKKKETPGHGGEAASKKEPEKLDT